MSQPLASLGFVLLAIVGPGIALQRLLRVRIDRALVIPLGLASAAALYWLGLVLAVPALFPAVVMALDLVLMLPPRPWTIAPGPRLGAALSVFGVLVVLLALTQFRWNRRAPMGEFLLDPMAPYDDAVFHVGLARELAAGYPPQVPGLAGVPLGYHFGPGLVRAAALRWAGVEPYDAISRLDPPLLGLGLVLAVGAVAYAMGAPPLAVTLAPWTLLFTDFSFVFAGNPSAFYWTDLLKGNLLLSLVHVNPVVPGLLLALGTLLALSRFLDGQGRAWLPLAIFQGAALPHFKVFLGAHLLLGLLAAGLFASRERRPRLLLPLLAVGAPCAALTALLAFGAGGETVSVSFAPLDLVRITRESLDLLPLTGAALAAWSLAWIVASLGLRLVGIEPALRSLRRGPAVAAALAAMALAGWPIGLLFRIAVREGLPGQKIVNDAAYFMEQGGPLLWIFAAIGLARLAERRGRPIAYALCLLALPSTVQFAYRKASAAPDPLPASMVRAMDALEAVAQPGEVVLQRPGARYPPAPVLLAGLRVPYERYTPFRTQFASKEFLEQRHEAVFRFFRTEDPEEALAIARSLGASYVALYGPDRLRFDTTGILEPVHQEAEASVFRIR
jgi:hypothetical protein